MKERINHMKLYVGLILFHIHYTMLPPIRQWQKYSLMVHFMLLVLNLHILIPESQ